MVLPTHFIGDQSNPSYTSEGSLAFLLHLVGNPIEEGPGSKEIRIPKEFRIIDDPQNFYEDLEEFA